MTKKNPIKNYLILGVIVIFTVILTFCFASWYKHNRAYKNDEISVINNVLSQIYISELDNYLLDNPNTVIYFSVSTDLDIGNFEKKFKNLILDNEISNEIVYIDINKINEKDYSILAKYFNNLLYSYDVVLKNKANLLIIKDGVVIDSLYKKNQLIDIKDVEMFLKKHEFLKNNDY